MLLFNIFVINLTEMSDGDASQMPYVPNGTKLYIATSTAYLRAVRYFISTGKNFTLYSDKHFRISLRSLGTLDWESLLCATIHGFTSQKKFGVAMCFVISYLRTRFNSNLW